jgi:hypothetical protein
MCLGDVPPGVAQYVCERPTRPSCPPPAPAARTLFTIHAGAPPRSSHDTYLYCEDFV